MNPLLILLLEWIRKLSERIMTRADTGSPVMAEKAVNIQRREPVQLRRTASPKKRGDPAPASSESIPPLLTLKTTRKSTSDPPPESPGTGGSLERRTAARQLKHIMTFQRLRDERNSGGKGEGHATDVANQRKGENISISIIQPQIMENVLLAN